jgi:hypothetical protein
LTRSGHEWRKGFLPEQVRAIAGQSNPPLKGSSPIWPCAYTDFEPSRIFLLWNNRQAFPRRSRIRPRTVVNLIAPPLTSAWPWIGFSGSGTCWAARARERPFLRPLTGLECCAGGRSWWRRQPGILAPWSTVPVGVPRALVCSNAPGGSSAGVLSGSTVGVDDITFGPTAGAADCSLIRFGSPAAAAGGTSVGSTAAGGSSDVALCGSTAGAGAKEILFGSTVVDAGCASFDSTAVAGSFGAFESCAGRGRGSDDAIRWR